MLTDLSFSGNSDWPLYLKFDSAATLDHMTGDDNRIDAIYLEQCTRSNPETLTLTGGGLPYTGFLDVGTAAKVVMGPGVVLKSCPVTVAGRLVSAGSTADRIVMTSMADDTHGGDANNDGSATLPALHERQKHELIGPADARAYAISIPTGL